MTIEMLSDDYAVEHVTRGDEALDRALHHSYRAMVMHSGLVGGSRVMEREWDHAPTQEQRTPLFR
jgi:hypothetical protein